MKNRKRTRIKAIGLFIIILALTTSFYFNGFKANKQIINSRDIDRQFEQMDNNYKMQIDINISNVDDFKTKVIKSLETIGATKITAVEKDSYALYLVQFKIQDNPQVIDLLSKAGKINSKIERVNTLGSTIDLEAKLRDKKEIYDKAREDYNNSKYRSELRRKELDVLSKEIDSLHYQLENQRNREKTLLYIKAISTTATNTVKIKDVKKFFYDFIKWFVIYLAAIVLIYYGSVLLVFLLSLIGIKLPSAPGYGGYGGYSGYGNYGSSYSSKGYSNERYGYGSYSSDYNRRRKVKRVYKNKPGTSNTDKSQEDSNS